MRLTPLPSEAPGGEVGAGAAEAGEEYYLMKPLKLEALIHKIDEVLGNKKKIKD